MKPLRVTPPSEHVVRCDCWRDDVIKRQLTAARVPQRYLHRTLDNFVHDTDTQREAWRKACAFVAAFPTVERGLWFYGNCGEGKSHLAVGILKACIAKGARGIFYETKDLLQLVRNTYNRSVETTELELLQPVLYAELLVLDDVGVGTASEWVIETLGLVVNTRYNAQRPTVFTTNLNDGDDTDPNSVILKLGVRTRSRLKEMCEWLPVEAGVDLREVEGGPYATDADIQRWRNTSPAAPTARSGRDASRGRR